MTMSAKVFFFDVGVLVQTEEFYKSAGVFFFSKNNPPIINWLVTQTVTME